MKQLVSALLLLGALGLAGANAQEADPLNRNDAVSRMVDSYATVLFAAAIENRCDHLDPDLEVVLYNNLISIENFIVTLIPPGAIVALKTNAAKEGANVEANPCGDGTKEFIKRVYPVASQLAENIAQAAGLTNPKN